MATATALRRCANESLSQSVAGHIGFLISHQLQATSSQKALVVFTTFESQRPWYRGRGYASNARRRRRWRLCLRDPSPTLPVIIATTAGVGGGQLGGGPRPRGTRPPPEAASPR